MRERTISDLRGMLFDEIDAIQNGESDPLRAQSVALVAGTIMESVKLEVEFFALVSRMDEQGLEFAPDMGTMPLQRGIEG